MNRIRQGDVLLVPVAKSTMEYMASRGRLVNVRRKRGEGVIVAAGELTGHHHRIRSRRARMYRHTSTGAVYVRVFECGEKEQQATLTHEEHEPLVIPPGWYQYQPQREYEPTAKTLSRRVYD